MESTDNTHGMHSSLKMSSMVYKGIGTTSGIQMNLAINVKISRSTHVVFLSLTCKATGLFWPVKELFVLDISNDCYYIIWTKDAWPCVRQIILLCQPSSDLRLPQFFIQDTGEQHCWADLCSHKFLFWVHIHIHVDTQNIWPLWETNWNWQHRISVLALPDLKLFVKIQNFSE